MNYRTTEQIRKWAVKLLEGEVIDDLDGGIEEQTGYKSLLYGVQPIVKNFVSRAAEINYIEAYLNEKLATGVPPQNICIITRTSHLIDRVYLPALESRGIQCIPLNRRETDAGEGIRFATMHRVKGLEFQEVIIAAANEGIIPLASGLKDSGDAVSRKDLELREKSLLYVAATRAREQLLITTHGKMSPFLSLAKSTSEYTTIG